MTMLEAMRADKHICPLLSIGQAKPVPCAGKLCAWLDSLTGCCSVFTGAESIRDAADQINSLNIILEGMEENAPASVCGTDGDGVEQIEKAVSTSNDTREPEEKQW